MISTENTRYPGAQMISVCEICQSKAVSQNTIFKTAGNPTPINLCHAHDQELFIMGQYRFVKKYKSNLSVSFHIVERDREKKSA